MIKSTNSTVLSGGKHYVVRTRPLTSEAPFDAQCVFRSSCCRDLGLRLRSAIGIIVVGLCPAIGLLAVDLCIAIDSLAVGSCIVIGSPAVGLYGSGLRAKPDGDVLVRCEGVATCGHDCLTDDGE